MERREAWRERNWWWLCTSPSVQVQGALSRVFDNSACVHIMERKKKIRATGMRYNMAPGCVCVCAAKGSSAFMVLLEKLDSAPRKPPVGIFWTWCTIGFASNTTRQGSSPDLVHSCLVVTKHPVVHQTQTARPMITDHLNASFPETFTLEHCIACMLMDRSCVSWSLLVQRCLFNELWVPGDVPACQLSRLCLLDGSCCCVHLPAFLLISSSWFCW